MIKQLSALQDSLLPPFTMDPKTAQQQQQQQQQQPNGQQSNNQQQVPNRLHLNFGFSNQQHNFAAEQGRAFPTTPSSFPQPYPNSSGQQEVWGTNQQPSSGFTPSGYFMNNPYTSQIQQQQTNLQAPSAAYRSPTSPSNYNDGTNGLVQQFSHQNLNSPRAASPFNRQPSPAQRPRTGGQTPTQQQYSQFLAPQSPREQPSVYDEEPPVKNPERFSTSISNRAKLQTELTGTFFRDSVERAKDRNERSVGRKRVRK